MSTVATVAYIHEGREMTKLQPTAPVALSTPPEASSRRSPSPVRPCWFDLWWPPTEMAEGRGDGVKDGGWRRGLNGQRMQEE